VYCHVYTVYCHVYTVYCHSITWVLTASRILHIVTHEPAIHLSHNIVIRKLGVKLIQRLGMTYLKSKVATWR